MSLFDKLMASSTLTPPARPPLLEPLKYKRMGRPKAVPDLEKPGLVAKLDQASDPVHPSLSAVVLYREYHVLCRVMPYARMSSKALCMAPL
jgi:hypothetical protein